MLPFTLSVPVQAQDCNRPPEFPKILTPVPKYSPERAGRPPDVPIRPVPQKYTPAYDCVLGFFEKSAFSSIIWEYTDVLLEHGLGIALDESKKPVLGIGSVSDGEWNPGVGAFLYRGPCRR